MLKVDNIIPLRRVVLSYMVSEPCPKLSHVNRILKGRTKNSKRKRSRAYAQSGQYYTIVDKCKITKMTLKLHTTSL